MERRLDSIMKMLPASRDDLPPVMAAALEQLRDEVIDGLQPATGFRPPTATASPHEQVRQENAKHSENSC